VTTDLREELAEYGRRQRAERRPVDMAEILNAANAAPASLDASIDSAVHQIEIEADGPRGDVLMFDSHWRVDESRTSERKLWIGALAAVAATVLIVAGVVVAANRNSGDVVPSSASPSPTFPQAPSRFDWSRVSDDTAGLRGDGHLSSVVAGGPGFVAVGSADSAAVWTSTDGARWSRVPHNDAIFPSGDISSVIVGGPGLVAVGTDESEGSHDAAVWTSPDGVTWSRGSHDEAVFGGPGDQLMFDVAIGGPGLVAVGHDSTTGAAVWTSVDGIIWSRVPPTDSIPSGDREDSMSSVTAGGPGLVAVGSNNDDDYATIPAVWTSPDGINWSVVPGEPAFSGGSAGYPQISSVTTGGPGLVAVGWIDYHAAVWTSPDGVAWSRVPHDDGIFGDSWTSMSDVIDIGSGLIAVGANNGQAAVWSSLDGVAWSRVPHDETLFGAPISTEQLGQAADQGVRYGITAVAAGPSGLVAVGLDGKVNGPPSDSIVWTAMPGNGP
jgi:hypothetical protein